MRKFIFLPLILFASAYLHGQKIELNNSVANYITKATPQALLFQKYGDIPVNTSTGIASVTVDMFEVKIKGVNWKIGLSYHSGGIKVNDISGSAGLGWSLNAIGMISSRMYQGCDAIVNLEGDVLANRRNYNLSVSTNPLGVCNYPNPTDIGYARNLIEMKGFADYTSFNYIPDIFYLNAGTLSGKFFIKKKKGYCMPARDLKIEVFNTPINFILVTDEAGNKYTFEQKGSNSQMVTNNNFEIEGAGGSGDPLTENPNFMLTKIENPFGEKIEFNYVIESYTYRGPDSDFYTDYPTQPANAPCTPGNDGFGINQRTWNHVEEARLESIITSTGEKVVFTYSARADIAGASKLDKVTLYSVLLLQDK
ncbi:MAG: hypothetical protein J7497_06965, partial [Chitinophagaceae bacterium]|nr:hypothetical protein [Chitinophagaceae bacterium]